MRVLYLIDSLAGGGAESVLANLINHLTQNAPQVECEVATLYPTSEKYLKEKKFPVRCLGLTTKYSPKGILQLNQLLSKHRYDIVHVHLFPANYYAAITSLHFPHLSWVYTEHNVWNRRRQLSPLRMVETLVYSRFDRIVAVSELVAANLKCWIPTVASRLHVIPNSVPVPKLKVNERAIDPDFATVLFAGRLERAKGIDILLEAFADVTIPSKLLLAGEGSLRAVLEEQAVELGIHNRVEFLGFRLDLQHLMAQADCVVLPSLWEGLPMVILEAMALGTPVIASKVGGIPEVIEDKVTGRLVPPEDPISLTNALAEVLSDKQKLRAMGQKARERIMECYSVETLCQRTLALYTEVLGTSRSVGQ